MNPEVALSPTDQCPMSFGQQRHHDCTSKTGTLMVGTYFIGSKVNCKSFCLFQIKNNYIVIVTSAGVQPIQSRVESITNFPRPRSNKSLQEYLGMLNFYRRFVPHAAAMLLPLSLRQLGLLDMMNISSAVKMHWPERHT